MNVRPEQFCDRDAISDVHRKVFPTEAEAKLVESLRGTAVELISLVAEVSQGVIGHILFSPVTMNGVVKIMGLGPMAVLPERQSKGVGTRLIIEGLKACEGAGCDAVVVLGHPDYYPRFGFLPAARFGIKSEYNAPSEAVMVLELQKGILKRTSGTVKYHRLFNDLGQK